MDTESHDTSETKKEPIQARADYGEPGDTYAAGGGDGVLDILKVVHIIEAAGIPCCMTGISALIWFGAGRVRWDWEISVPTNKLDQVVHMLKSPPHDQIYKPWKPEHVQLYSLTHTFARFKLRGVALRFQIIPSDDGHFDISQVDRSQSGLPYPKLELFVQSLLETQRTIDLCDLVDGMNLSEEWGEEHLNLDKTTDIAYAKEKNKKIMASVLPGEDPVLQYAELSIYPVSLREIWQEAVRGKQKRISKGLPTEYFATRFFAHGQGDPRLKMDRPNV